MAEPLLSHACVGLAKHPASLYASPSSPSTVTTGTPDTFAAAAATPQASTPDVSNDLCALVDLAEKIDPTLLGHAPTHAPSVCADASAPHALAQSLAALADSSPEAHTSLANARLQSSLVHSSFPGLDAIATPATSLDLAAPPYQPPPPSSPTSWDAQSVTHVAPPPLSLRQPCVSATTTTTDPDTPVEQTPELAWFADGPAAESMRALEEAICGATAAPCPTASCPTASCHATSSPNHWASVSEVAPATAHACNVAPPPDRRLDRLRPSELMTPRFDFAPQQHATTVRRGGVYPTAHSSFAPIHKEVTLSQPCSPVTPPPVQRRSPSGVLDLAHVPSTPAPPRPPQLSPQPAISRPRTTARKPKTYAKPVASRFCHICSRMPRRGQSAAVCLNMKRGLCRKIVCERCIVEQGWDLASTRAGVEAGTWLCPHCAGVCPPRSQCHIYNRINARRKRVSDTTDTALSARSTPAAQHQPVQPRMTESRTPLPAAMSHNTTDTGPCSTPSVLQASLDAATDLAAPYDYLFGAAVAPTEPSLVHGVETLTPTS